MNRSDLAELHFITMITNAPSIVQNGILCNRRAKQLQHDSIAMLEIQDLRANKIVPGGRALHDYANLYFSARNPMLYKRRDLHIELCVLRVSTDVLDLPGVVIADGNAASNYTAFWPSPSGLDKVDKDLVFAKYWTDANQIAEWQKKRVKCAEVLVPDRVDQRFIIGACVSCDEALRTFKALEPHLNVSIDSHLFFR